MIRLICLCFALILGAGTVTLPVTSPALAQGRDLAPDYDAWQRTADRADDAIEAGRASTIALETLRKQLADWRQQFVAAEGINANAIDTVKNQLDALGPVPESGEEEANIARNREALNDRLAQLEAPVKIAELAKNRADSLIKGVDGIINERQAEALLELGPSPLNPANWAAGLLALKSTFDGIGSEFSTAWNNPVQRMEAKGNLLQVILLSVLGLVLVFRGRRWSRRMVNWVLTDHPGAGRWLGAFALSLGSLILPFIGLVALTEAAFATNLVGVRSGQLISALIPPFFVFLLTRWLAMRIFPAKEARSLPLNLSPAQRFSGRWYGAAIGFVSSAYFFVQGVAEGADWSEAGLNVVLFPFVVIVGLLMLRMAGLFRAHSVNSAADEGDENFRSRLMRLVAVVVGLVGVLSPIVAGLGYFALAQKMMFPSVLTLMLLGALLVLQRLVVELYVLITGNREASSESLIPVLIGMVLVLASLPLFALAWGARSAQLWELWTQFTEGVSVGGVRISPTVFLTFAVIFTIGYAATRLLQGALKSTILPKTKLDQGGRNAIVSGVGYIGLFLAATIAITGAGLDLSSIAIVAGALSVGIGFGLRTIVENFVSGIILLIERPISEGDWIEVGGVHGTVRDISVRSTRIETFDRSDVIVPNADLISGRVTNYTRGNTVGRLIVPVGVAYGSDTRKIEEILREVAEAQPMVLANPAPNVIFKSFGADSLDFEIRAILRDINWVMSVHSDINHEIARRFVEEGIEIPFSQRDIWIRNPEALSGGQGTPPPPPDAAPPTEAANTPDPATSAEGDAAGDGGDR